MVKRLTGARRVAALAASAFLCAIVSVVAVLRADLSSALASAWQRELVIAIALGAAVLGFAASVLLLWGVNLVKAIPLVFGVTVLSAALMPFMNAFAGLIVGVLTMQWCSSYPPWQLQPPVAPGSVFREGLKGLAGPPPPSGGEAT